jgi:DNA-binding response OmpR family regulator
MPIVALIEDDPLVRIPLARGLDAAGYTVLVAADGPEGLALLEGHAVDVAVVDVILPGRVDGIGVVREARRHNPGLKVILTSGRPLEADLTGMAPFVMKPLRLDDLLAHLRRVIDNEDPADGRDVMASARQVIDEFGELAMFYAVFRAGEWRDQGDREQARTWTRVLKAIEQLRGSETPTETIPH